MQLERVAARISGQRGAGGQRRGLRGRRKRGLRRVLGGVAEWSKAAVLKGAPASSDSRSTEKLGSDGDPSRPEMTPHGAVAGHSMGHTDEVERAVADALLRIRALFKLEEDWASLAPKQRHERRQRISRPMLDDFFAWKLAFMVRSGSVGSCLSLFARIRA